MLDIKSIKISEDIILDNDKKHLAKFVADYFHNPDLKAKGLANKYNFSEFSLYLNIPRLKLGQCYKCKNGHIIGTKFNRTSVKQYSCNSCGHSFDDRLSRICNCKYCEEIRKQERQKYLERERKVQEDKLKTVSKIYSAFPNHKVILKEMDLFNDLIEQLFKCNDKFFHIYEIEKPNGTYSIDFCEVSLHEAYELVDKYFQYFLGDDSFDHSSIKLDYYEIKEKYFSSKAKNAVSTDKLEDMLEKPTGNCFIYILILCEFGDLFFGKLTVDAAQEVTQGVWLSNNEFEWIISPYHRQNPLGHVLTQDFDKFSFDSIKEAQRFLFSNEKYRNNRYWWNHNLRD